MGGRGGRGGVYGEWECVHGESVCGGVSRESVWGGAGGVSREIG